MKNNSLIAMVLVIVLITFGVGVYLYSSNIQEKNSLSEEEQNALVRDYALVAGNPNAKVTVVEFMDPSCGTCIYFSPIVESLSTKYDDKVKVVYRFLPYFNGSDFILSLVKAANEQGKFKEALKQFLAQHNRWYANHQVNPFVAWGILQEVGVDIEIAKKFLDENADTIKEQFKQNEADAEVLKVTGTPTFYVNGRLLKNLSHEELIKLVEDEIKKVY